MKKRSFGLGKWNGPGGKVLEGETIKQAMVREVGEEIGVVIDPAKLKKISENHFNFIDKPEWSQICHVFEAREWRGEPAESEEMAPKWFAESELPYEKMWEDDRHWLARALSGEKLESHFQFNQKGEIAGPFEIKTI